jgi:Tol biopolymer transport system component
MRRTAVLAAVVAVLAAGCSGPTGSGPTAQVTSTTSTTRPGHSGEPFSDLMPRFSRDGEQIAFTRRYGLDGVTLPNEVISREPFVVDLRTGEALLRRHDPELGLDKEPWVSPDGARRVDSCAGNLCVRSLTDGSVRQLTADPRREDEPVWSPDGKTIAFTLGPAYNIGVVMQPDGYPPQICLLDVEALTRRCLTEGASPSWSPTGNKIAFVRMYDGGTPLTRIWILDVNSGATRWVT